MSTMIDSTIICNTASGFVTYAAPISSTFSNTMNSSSDLIVSGDITLDGVSLKNILEKIQDRLNILTPDPRKLEKYEALRAAYENYQLIEKLLKD